ncbi:MAG: hypothetical protein LW878_09065 [Proteobacteria bacterium]|nr:hypothetical protein [Pseudomonadota bacterium]
MKEKFFIMQVFDGQAVEVLKNLPEVQLLNDSTSLTQKIIQINGAWIRDHIVKLNDQWFESCNTSPQKKNIMAEFLRKQGVAIRHEGFIPIQGGHLVRLGQTVYCASSCGINPMRIERSFHAQDGHKWELETIPSFESGISSRAIKKFDPHLKVLPSLVDFPWSYHLDLVIAPLGENKILLSDPLMGCNHFSEPHKHALQVTLDYYTFLLTAQGFEVIPFPVYFDGSDGTYHSPLNGLKIGKYFFYTLIRGMDGFNQFVMSYAESLSASVEFLPVYLNPSGLGKKGGLRCLSLEID